ncbi:hypothetical protein SAMN02745165_03096 [Malonomonas rubra DSM 5091]|uniref:Uncharacterized protein n=1 Tax=Malonomonas rubra DSM 5091 TaxID=1122189 RepID=A0A1M6LXK4_MALRU|nr:hypothetical protein [Malonomonas rubra]SHJ75901.1 hypothetical protein SAMN02745165_03096 [Malonomonas rubra DSM 5091]
MYGDVKSNLEKTGTEIIISNEMPRVFDDEKILVESEAYDKNLIIAYPNMLNKTGKWHFKVDGRNLRCYIKDFSWVDNLFEHGEPKFVPQQYMQATLKNGPVGQKGKIEPYIVKVHKVMKSFDSQLKLSLAA